MWRRRLSTGTRWGCTALSGLILFALSGSMLWLISCHLDFRIRRFSMSLDHASLLCWVERPSIPTKCFTVLRFPPNYPFALDVVPIFAAPASGTMICLPLYIPLAVSLTFTALLWRREFRHRRVAKAGACGVCGYDRRGLDAAAKCPECGVRPVGV